MSEPTPVPIGELVAPVKTWVPEREAPDQPFTYVDLSAVDQNAKQIVGERQVLGATAPSRARQIVAAGDVLVSTVRPNLNGVARVPPELDEATASTGFCVLRPEPQKLDGAFLARLCGKGERAERRGKRGNHKDKGATGFADERGGIDS